MLRFRQAVLAARDLDAAVQELRSALPLGEPYADPGVAYFGLRNAVMPLGDTFVEVVSPVQEDTAAGRFLDRRGDGAYMAMFQIEDLSGARERAAALGVREVWAADLDDISAAHLIRWTSGRHRLARPPRAAGVLALGRPVAPAWRRPHHRPDALGARPRGAWRPLARGPRQLELDDGRVDVRAGDEDAIVAFHIGGLGAGEIHAAGAAFFCTRV